MEETRAVARLPHLDVEITHRRGAADDEQLSIHLRASPSFRGFTDYLDAKPLFWPWLAFAPLLAWQQAMRSFYAPWLPGDFASLARRTEQAHQHHDPEANIHPFPGPEERRN